jgi:hypothetical protein
VIHVELNLSDSGMRFAAGDAVGVLPSNDPALVAALLARLGVDGDDVFEVQSISGGCGMAVALVSAWGGGDGGMRGPAESATAAVSVLNTAAYSSIASIATVLTVYLLLPFHFIFPIFWPPVPGMLNKYFYNTPCSRCVK